MSTPASDSPDDLDAVIAAAMAHADESLDDDDEDE